MPPAAAFLFDGVSVVLGGYEVLVDLDLVVEPATVLAVVGPSGAGKTTLLTALLGAVPVTGEVRVDDRALSKLTPAALRRVRTRIGYIPQDLGLVPNLRVLPNVITGRLGRHGVLGALRRMVLPNRAERLAVLGLLHRLGIPEKLFQRVDSLSGGERQRVAIARALYQEPGALLADEPLSALDPARARETIELLVDLARERGLTLVLSMHDIELAREFVPRLVGLRRGRIVFDRPGGAVTDDDVADLYRLEDGGPA